MTQSEARQLEAQINELEYKIARESSPYTKRALSRKLSLLKTKILDYYAETNNDELL